MYHITSHNIILMEEVFLPKILWQHIFDLCTFKSQLNMQETCWRFNSLKIYTIPDKYNTLLTDEILSQGNRYKWLIELDASYNHKITNVNHISKLKVLRAVAYGINDHGIKDLNLYELYAWDNRNITNVNHMTNLKILDASFSCGIDDDGIKDLNLVELDAWSNKKITNVNHMTNLKVLIARRNCGIGDDGIKDLNLTELHAQDNTKITNVNHMTNLKIYHRI
jgi:hypothetical protein